MDNEMLNQIEQNANTELIISLDSMEIDTIGEILNISMGSAATAVSTLLSRKVNITTPTVSVVKTADLSFEKLDPAIGIEIEYVEGLTGFNFMVMKLDDIKAIVSLLIPDMESSDDGPLDEFHISAISEIMNQMMGSSATALASFLGKNINISTPKTFDVDNNAANFKEKINDPEVVCVSFTLEVEDLLNSEFVTLMKLDFTKKLVASALNFDDVEEPQASAPKEIVEEKQPPKSSPAPNPAPIEEKKKPEEKRSNNAAAKESSVPVNVKPVKFQSFDDAKILGELDELEQENFNLILGVPLDVSVEIGRTKMSVKNILELRQGSVIELDRQAGDPVDIIVNGQLIAKGDVVIIDDNFGVRITEIISTKDMSKKLS